MEIKRLIVVTCFLIICSSCLALAQKRFSIKGSFKTKYNGSICLVYGAKKDTIKVVDGAFQFKGSIALPVNAYIQVETGTSKATPSTKFYIDPEPMEISIDTATRVYSGQSFFLAFANVEKAGETTRLIRDFKSGLSTKVLKEINQQAEMYVAEMHDFLLVNKGKMATVVILSEFNHLFTGNELKQFYKGLSADVQQTPEAGKIKAAIDKDELALTGSVLRNFSQNDPNGKSIALSSLRGKYVLVDFWASWCLPCRAENPNLLKAYQKFKDKGFEIIGVSLDSNKESWIKAINDDHLPWLQISDLKGWKNEVSAMFKISAIPDNFLIDRDGKIIGKGLRGTALEKKLAAILSDK